MCVRRLNLGDELIAQPAPGGDQPWCAAGIAQGLAQFLDGLGDGADRSGVVSPDGIEQLILADHAGSLLDQVAEDGKSPRPQADRTVGPRDGLLPGIEHEFVEYNFQCAVSFAVRSSLGSPMNALCLIRIRSWLLYGSA